MNPFGNPKNFNDPFYYDDQGVIRGFEKSIEMSKDVLKSQDEQMKIFQKLRKSREQMPSLFKTVYEDINMLQERQLTFEREMTVKEIIQVMEHIQILKNIVALEKITRTSIKEIHDSKKVKVLEEILDIVRHDYSSVKKEIAYLKKKLKFTNVNEDSKD